MSSAELWSLFWIIRKTGLTNKDRFAKLNLLPLEYRRDLKDLVLIFKTKAGHIDLSSHQDFFHQTENTPLHASLTIPFTLCKTKLFKTLINSVKLQLIEYSIIVIDRIEKLTCLNPWLERLHVLEKCSKNNKANL